MVKSNALRPIVEFFPIYDLEEGSDLFDDTVPQHQKNLKSALESARGIYAFYNSEGEVIYIGKTERQNLWKRMRHSYFGEKSRYERYYVKHPRSRFSLVGNDRIRGIIRKKFALCDVASFCSAYTMPPRLISFSEKLLIRVIPNDLINLRMEGNKTLPAYKPKRSTKKIARRAD